MAQIGSTPISTTRNGPLGLPAIVGVVAAAELHHRNHTSASISVRLANWLSCRTLHSSPLSGREADTGGHTFRLSPPSSLINPKDDGDLPFHEEGPAWLTLAREHDQARAKAHANLKRVHSRPFASMGNLAPPEYQPNSIRSNDSKSKPTRSATMRSA